MGTNIVADRSKFSIRDSAEKLTIIESYDLVTDTVGEYPSLLSLPTIHDQHPFYTQAYVTDVTIQPTSQNNRVHYYAIVTYETPEGSRFTKFNFDVSTVSDILDRDIYGNPITNSAGEIPENELQKEIPVIIVNAKKAFATLDIVNWSSYVGKINSTTWTPSNSLLSFPPERIHCVGLTLEDFDINSKSYIVNFKFIYDPEGFMLEFIDKGYSYYDITTNRTVWSYENIDKRPKLLNGWGSLFGQAPTQVSYPLGKPAGATVVNLPASPATATGTFLKWNIYNTTDMNAIGL